MDPGINMIKNAAQRLILVVVLVTILPPVYTAEFTLVECNPTDQVTKSGSEYTFTSTVTDYTGCRATADTEVPVTPESHYTVTADIKPGELSTPGIIFNIAGIQDFDMILFRTSNYNCVLRATMAGGAYTEDSASNTYCDGYRIYNDQWFQVALTVYASKFSVSINNAFTLEFPTNHPQLVKYGFLHGYGYEVLCGYDCSFKFRLPDITAENVLIEKFDQQGILQSPAYGSNTVIPQNTIYQYRIHLDRVGQDLGTTCYLAFYSKDVDIGTATLAIHDRTVTARGQILMFSTRDATFDVYFTTGSIDPSKRGFQLLYQVFSCSAPSQDLGFLCIDGNYNHVPDAFYRSTGYIRGTNDYTSDTSLAMGWYRFDSCVGEHIPSTDPGGINKCGTKYPIYIKDYKAPAPGDITDATACVSNGVTCIDQWKMPIYVCPDFSLYYLVPTVEESGYCAGSDVTCASQDKVSIGGDGCEPCSTGRFPEIPGNPTLGEWTYDDTQEGMYNLPCNIDDLPDPNMVEFEVKWFVVFENRREEILHEEHLKKMPHYLPSNTVSKDHLQNNIICRVRANFENLEESGPWVESTPFFIGIRPVHAYREITHDTIYNFEVEFTMPFTCDGTNCLKPDDPKCFVDVHFLTETKHLSRHGCANVIYKEPELLQTGLCSQTVRCTSNVNNANVWQKSTARKTLKVKNTMLKGVPSHTHTMYMVVRDSRGMWQNIVSQAQIHVNMDSSENHLTSRCKVWNDPHITTFEGSEYDSHLPGEYLVHRSIPLRVSDMELVITDQIEYCRGRNWRSGPGCNVAHGIRIKDEAIILDRKKVPKHRYITADTGKVESRFKLTQTNNYRNYQIYLPRGEVVLVSVAFYYNNFMYLTIDSPREAQLEPIEPGLCGRIFPGGRKSKNQPELLYRNFEPYTKPFAKWADLHDFSRGWKVNTKEKLIDKVSLEPSPDNTPTTDYYTCSVHDISDFILGVHDGQFEPVPDRERCVPYRRPNLLEKFRGNLFGRKKRSFMTKVTKRKRRSTSKRNVDDVWTTETAQAYCQTNIAESPVGVACKSIIPAEELEGVLEQCALDIMLTNSTDWAIGTLTSLREVCVFAMYQDLTLWTTDIDEVSNTTVLRPPLNLLNNMCPDNCTNNGECVDGQCECYEGYIGYDCSLSIDTPPTLGGFADGAVCYGNDGCDEVVLVGEDFVDSDQLTCHFWMGEVKSGDSNLANKQAIILDTDLVTCPYPAIASSGSTHTLFSVGISNDGVHPSEGLTAALVHKECMVCNHTEDLTVSCHLQAGMCLIESQCISANNVSADDPCMQCDPEADQYSWSEKADCNETPTQTPQPNPLTQLPRWVYIAIGAGGAVILLLIIIIAAICCRKKSPRDAPYRK